MNLGLYPFGHLTYEHWYKTIWTLALFYRTLAATSMDLSPISARSTSLYAWRPCPIVHKIISEWALAYIRVNFGLIVDGLWPISAQTFVYIHVTWSLSARTLVYIHLDFGPISAQTLAYIRMDFGLSVLVSRMLLVRLCEPSGAADTVMPLRLSYMDPASLCGPGDSSSWLWNAGPETASLLAICCSSVSWACNITCIVRCL